MKKLLLMTTLTFVLSNLFAQNKYPNLYLYQYDFNTQRGEILKYDGTALPGKTINYNGNIQFVGINADPNKKYAIEITGSKEIFEFKNNDPAPSSEDVAEDVAKNIAKITTRNEKAVNDFLNNQLENAKNNKALNTDGSLNTEALTTIKKNFTDELKLDEKTSMKVGKELEKLAITKLEGDDNTTVYSPTIPIEEADAYSLGGKITIKDEDTEYKLQTEKFWVKRAWKFNFSTGIGVSGLEQREYRIFTNDAGRKSIVRADNNKVDYVLTTLLHIYPTSGTIFNGGLATGVALDTKGKFQMLLGGSFMLGRKERFVFTAGMAMGNRMSLMGDLKEGDEINDSKYDENNYKAEKWSFSWFASISVNLLSGKNVFKTNNSQD